MKVISVKVDEIPNSCGECCLMEYISDTYPVCCALPEEIREITGNPYDMKYRRHDCPLKSEVGMTMTEETKQKIQKIAQTYGYDEQSRQCIEEMAELTQAINKYWRKALVCGTVPIPSKDGYMPMLPREYDNLVEEIADVQIMLWQMEYLLNADTSIIIQQKLDRRMERIEME